MINIQMQVKITIFILFHHNFLALLKTYWIYNVNIHELYFLMIM